MSDSLLRRVLTELNAETPPALAPLPQGDASALSACLPTADLALASIAAATISAGLPSDGIDPVRVAAAYRSDRSLLLDDCAPPVWSPLSGFWATNDGWVRTHGNYPHHAEALRRALHLSPHSGPAEMAAVLAGISSVEAIGSIDEHRGLAVVVDRERPSTDEVLRSRPLVRFARDAADARPGPFDFVPSDGRSLAGIRVLDLTRVIAGPVCARTLALLGADVLRIDPPGMPEPEWQHLDTGHGKRSAVLDARSDRMESLLSQADAVVLGYRPAALVRLGLDPAAIVRRHPHLVIAQLSAWGTDHPERAGFDSLVQAESGIAWIESADGVTPGALRAQALDHSAGYLLAAAMISLLRRSAPERAGWHVSTSLRRIAAELLGMQRRSASSDDGLAVPAAHTARFDVGGHEIVTARPAIPGLEFAAPRAWGRDQPTW